MKIYIKFNQQESNQWKAIKGAVIGEQSNMSDGEFAKIMLFRGLNSFMDDVNKAVDEMSDDEKTQVLEQAGVKPEVEVEVPNMSELQNENAENSDG